MKGGSCDGLTRVPSVRTGKLMTLLRGGKRYTLQEMADVFFKKTEGILNLTGGENYEPKYSEGVNYKLFVNSCTYQNGKGFFM